MFKNIIKKPLSFSFEKKKQSAITHTISKHYQIGFPFFQVNNLLNRVTWYHGP